MLPDLSPAHILIVVVVALIVVGPKDLPMLLRKIGQFMGKMRGMANEFRASFDEMARQSELDELRKEVEAMRAAADGATPDLGLDADLSLTDARRSDDEGAVMHDWSPGQLSPEAEPTILPPNAAKPVKIAKVKSSAPGKAAKAPAAKSAAKPRAKKAKPAAEAGS